MLRSVILAVLGVSAACAAIWPEQLGKHKLRASMAVNNGSSSSSASRPDLDGLDKEYGREDGEEADYGQFQVIGTRYKDSTGAHAAWLQASAKPMQVGNYLVTCTGKCPKDLVELADAGLPRVSHAALPVIPSYLPTKNQLSDSQRYILGPIGLSQTAPQIPEAAAAFQFGTEAAMARYRVGKNEATLAIFSYPTPGIARQQLPAFQAIPGAVAKRTGPLVAVVVGLAEGAAAANLLNQINYEASVTVNEPMPLVLTPQSTAQMILAIISLAGIVLGFCLVSGLLFGALRVLARRFGYSDAGIAMTTLHLSDK